VNLKKSSKIGSFLVILTSFFCWPYFAVYSQDLVAAKPLIRIYDSETLKIEKEFFPFDTVVKNFSLAAADIDGDGRSEIVVGMGFGGEPMVKIFDSDGSYLRDFLAYDKNFTGGIQVVGTDLDNDKKDEIVTAPGKGGGPHVRIFDGTGTPKINIGWMAFAKDYTQGINIAAGDINGDDQEEIAVARVYNVAKSEVKIFDKNGNDLKLGFKSNDYIDSLGLSMVLEDFGGDKKTEMVSAGRYNSLPVIDLRRIDGSKINSWKVFGDDFKGGVNIASGDTNGDGKKEIIVGAGYTGSPSVKIFDSFGREEKKFFAFDQDLTTGVQLAIGQFDDDKSLEIVVAPDKLPDINVTGKLILVDTGSKQTLYAYDSGFLVRSFLISSGTKYLKTPLGNFSIWRKRPTVHMFGPGYDLPGVPWVLSFKGPYTIHGTYWHSNFGHPMSHGCVNMYTPDAKWIYNWSVLGMPVEILKN
jgi:lipoprotein-anchoring transpeptidase ErfK/SrfK